MDILAYAADLALAHESESKKAADDHPNAPRSSPSTLRIGPCKTETISKPITSAANDKCSRPTVIQPPECSPSSYPPAYQPRQGVALRNDVLNTATDIKNRNSMMAPIASTSAPRIVEQRTQSPEHPQHHPRQPLQGIGAPNEGSHRNDAPNDGNRIPSGLPRAVSGFNLPSQLQSESRGPAQPLPLRRIEEPNENDVLSGRGNNVNYHPGNLYFRHLVKELKIDYVAALKQDKPVFSKSIVQIVRNGGGRFLKQDAKTGLWNDIGDKQALAKTRQALREGAPRIEVAIDLIRHQQH